MSLLFSFIKNNIFGIFPVFCPLEACGGHERFFETEEERVKNDVGGVQYKTCLPSKHLVLDSSNIIFSLLVDWINDLLYFNCITSNTYSKFPPITTTFPLLTPPPYPEYGQRQVFSSP